MIQKQSLPINFAKGLDTKTDEWQISPENFLSLENQVFNKGGKLTKRNGFEFLTTLPSTNATYLTTLHDNLTVIGTSIYAYNETNATWVTRGHIAPMQVNTLPLIKNNINQTQVDTAVSYGLVCTVYSEINNSTNDYKYAVADVITGQNIISPTLLPGAGGTVTGSPRVFVLANYFVIVYTTVPAGSNLIYIAISIGNPSVVTSPQTIAASYTSSPALSWDGVVADQYLYIAYNTTSGGQSVKVTSLSAAQAAGGSAPATAKTFATYKATHMSLTADMTGASPIIWVNFYRSDTSLGFVLAVDKNLNTVLAPTATIPSGTIVNIASAAQNGVCTLFFETSNFYAYDANVPTNYISKYTITQAGVVSSASVVIRSVGLASKGFIVSGVIYFLSEYLSLYQPTYFLINGSISTSAAPIVVGKLAYQNGNAVTISSATLGYLPLGLPNVTVLNTNECYVGYLFKDLIAAVNKGTALTSGTQTNGIYSQTGINLGTFIIGAENVDTAEIGNDLLISGGFLWMYDGYLPVEQNFFLYPDNVEVTTATGSGGLVAQDYYYQALYEWMDNQGNVYRSAASIPVKQTTTTSSSTNTIKVPTLRLTYKTANPAKIVVYRWSTAQQVYYQITSLSAPTLNDTTADVVTITDALSDAAILGNNIIYTNGGVVENVNPPASNIMTLFDTRFWLVDAEDKNLLWYSKQVIEATPVEMSDLFTFFVAPSQAAQGSTGPITALAPLDDKLIVFKANAIYYINGTGPDNTGASNQYSQPIFVTSTVGCTNQQSIVFMPQGLMFQSEKGIWLLGRDLQTLYIGAAVEAFNTSTVQSAVNVPETNQVRFTLNTGETLVYDYFYQQWSTFAGAPAISSCIYHSLHTILNSFGAVYQESPGSFLDGSNPVLISIKSAWYNLAGLQGYIRAYFFYLIGKYLSPHKLQVSIAYDYNPAPSQVTLISPTNYGGVYGGPTPNPGNGTDAQSPYGQSALYGGLDSVQYSDGNMENWRIFLSRQRCMSFQISIQEIYDASFGVPAGEGLTLSGINLIYGAKKSFRPISSAHSIGGRAK